MDFIQLLTGLKNYINFRKYKKGEKIMNSKQKIYSIIGKRIKEERKNLNLTQEEFAAKVNMSYKFLSRIESSAEKPSLDMIIKLSNALNVPIVSLFVEKKDKLQLRSLKDKVQYLFPELSNDKLERLTNIIKEARNLVK